MAHDVFISYASEDQAIADAACHALEAQGIRCWIAHRNVVPGGSWPEAIVDAIHGAKVMVLVFSASANGSQHIAKEVERAASRSLPIIPMRIEKVKPAKSLEYFMSAVHWLDAMSPPIERALEQLVGTVRTLLARSEEQPKPSGSWAHRMTPPEKPPGRDKKSQRRLYIGVGVAVVVFLLALRGLTSLFSPSTPSVLVGTWRWYTGAEVVVRKDGKFSSGTFVGRWRPAGVGPLTFTMTWPPAVDQVTLSEDGRRLTGANQYGVRLTARRIAVERDDLTGSWTWWNGATVVMDSDGNITAGPISGEWKVVSKGARQYALTWPPPEDVVTVSADGTRLEGANQFGFRTTARKAAP